LDAGLDSHRTGEEAAKTTSARRRSLGKKFEWKLLFGDHHESHAASAFYPSPFEEAAILTIDGVGEWATSSIGIGKGKRDHAAEGASLSRQSGIALQRVHLLHRVQSVNSGEYKVMGLAPYGEPKYVSLDQGQAARDSRRRQSENES
jgi:carbamoyltransferase